MERTRFTFKYKPEACQRGHWEMRTFRAARTANDETPEVVMYCIRQRKNLGGACTSCGGAVPAIDMWPDAQ
jgi:hypothetical protein